MTQGMQIPYEVKPSGRHGNGVFATQDVAKGTLVWSFSHCADLNVLPEAAARAFLDSAPKDDLRDVLHCCYWDYFGPNMTGLVDLRRDVTRYINHDADAANTGNTDYHEDGGPDPHSTYALRDIKAGEEILENYNSFHQKTPKWYYEFATKVGYDFSFVFGTKKES